MDGSEAFNDTLSVVFLSLPFLIFSLAESVRSRDHVLTLFPDVLL
jgi:hypothetical protein